MTQETVALQIADARAAMRYLGEMQSRPMDPIHEPIQNLLDEGAKRIDVDLDVRRHRIRVRGDARPIPTVAEARRILQSICASKKRDKLGEKGVGMLSFVTVGSSMTTLSQQRGRVVWFTLDRENLAEGRVGQDKGTRLPFAGTEIAIKGVGARSLKYRFSEERVIRDVKRRWGAFFSRGVSIRVNGHDVAAFEQPLAGDPFHRTIRVKSLGKSAVVEVHLQILKEPSDVAAVSVTHKGQANFLVADVPLFDGHNAFTQGMLHGTISGDVVPINASRTGMNEGPELDAWMEVLLDLEDELGRLIEDRIRTAAESRDQKMLDDWMNHLRSVFSASELASVETSRGEGDEEGWSEAPAGEDGGEGAGEEEGAGGEAVGTTDRRPRKGGRGRLPTVPYARFTKAPPNVRVVRERKLFRINVNHPDFILAAKSKRGRRLYIRELCMHEAYIYSLEGRPKEFYIGRADEFLGYWTRAFAK